MSDICTLSLRLNLGEPHSSCHSESAATLEAESGYVMEAPEVSDFREYILEGSWLKAEAALLSLGINQEEGIWVRLVVCAHIPINNTPI